jgi:hypothetical protein
MFSAPREPPRKPTGFQSWGDRDETTEHFFIAIKKAEEFRSLAKKEIFIK